MTRFVVVGVTGYPLGGGEKLSTSYSVLDSAWNYGEVERFYVSEGRPPDISRETQAHEAAARLEALYGDGA